MMNSKNTGADGRPAPVAGLMRQSSIYSLTFDEFQNTMGGQDFGSMNMDELLKNIWTAEESQLVSTAVGAGGAATAGTALGVQRQGSFTLPRTLSQKTVDEVWRELVGEGVGGAVVGGGGIGPLGTELHQQQQQTPLREMTLEEFLVRAGVAREDINQAPTNSIISNSILPGTGTNCGNIGGVDTVFYSDARCASSSTTGIDLGFTSVIDSPGTTTGASLYVAPLANHQGMCGAGIVGIGDPALSNGLMPGIVGMVPAAAPHAVVSLGSQMMSSSDGFCVKSNGDNSSLSPARYVFDSGMRGVKCSAVEKVVERRNRRMIKNRESAARSRARKQAYIVELEAEVAKLKELNQELEKKNVEVLVKQKHQVLEKLSQQHGPKQHGPKRQCLRRTRTGPW